MCLYVFAPIADTHFHNMVPGIATKGEKLRDIIHRLRRCGAALMGSCRSSCCIIIAENRTRRSITNIQATAQQQPALLRVGNAVKTSLLLVNVSL